LRRALLACLLCALVGAGCGRREAPAEFRLLIWNLDGWRELDRDGDFQADDPKPEAERAAIAAVIAREKPDALLALDLGTDADLALLRDALARAGYPLPSGGRTGEAGEGGLALLTATAPAEVATAGGGVYRIGDSGELRARPLLEAGLPGLRLLGGFLRESHPGAKGQDFEVRRNEARLLGQAVAAAAKATSNLVVSGTFNDDPDSPQIRAIRAWRDEERVEALPLRDPSGAGWTRVLPGADRFDRRDYVMVSPALKALWVPEKSRVVELPHPAPSRHRPLLVVFRRAES
jgi:hypothetical protein